jgi:hypothetical protein
MHLSGALGMYHWEIGNLSWDIIVHITNGFIGTLLFASALADSAAVDANSTTRTHSNDFMMPNSNSSSGSGASAVGGRGPGEQHQHLWQHVWQQRAVGVLKVTVLLLLSTCMVEVVEAAGGQLAGHTGACRCVDTPSVTFSIIVKEGIRYYLQYLCDSCKQRGVAAWCKWWRQQEGSWQATQVCEGSSHKMTCCGLHTTASLSVCVCGCVWGVTQSEGNTCAGKAARRLVLVVMT